MKIGSHVSNNGKLMLLGSIKEALSYGETCFMVYLGAPQNTVRKPFSALNIDEMKKVANENNINLEDIIIHAPYIVNPARCDEERHQFAIDFLKKELTGVDMIGAKYLILHPGSAVDTERSEAIKNVASVINKVIEETKGSSSVITIETMAGKGNEVGRCFEEVRDIISLVNDKTRIGVCLDTCHINDAGYDLVNHYDDVFNDFDKIIGLNYLKVLHVNDSKNSLSSHKDRHENIGFGEIGFEALHRVITDPRFTDIPKILETPYIPSCEKNESYPPYKEEIEMIKKGIFNPSLKEEIIKNHTL